MIIVLLILITLSGTFLNFASGQCPNGWEPDGSCTFGKCAQTSQLCHTGSNNCCQMSRKQARLQNVRNPKTGVCEQTYCPLGSYKDKDGCSIKGFCISSEQKCINKECCNKYYLPNPMTASQDLCSPNMPYNPNNPNMPYNPNNPNMPYNPNNPNMPYNPNNPNMPYNPNNPNMPYNPNNPNMPYNNQMPNAPMNGMIPVFNSNRQPAITNQGLPIFTMNGQLCTSDGRPVYSNGQPLYTENGQMIGGGGGNGMPLGGSGYQQSGYPPSNGIPQVVANAGSGFQQGYQQGYPPNSGSAYPPGSPANVGGMPQGYPPNVFSGYQQGQQGYPNTGSGYPPGSPSNVGFGSNAGSSSMGRLDQNLLQQACGMPEQQYCSTSVAQNRASCNIDTNLAYSCPLSCGLCNMNG